jgi:hypothetical protein
MPEMLTLFWRSFPAGRRISMATRSSARDRGIPSDPFVVLAWYFASILAYSGALRLIHHWRPPYSRNAFVILDRETFIALGCWLAGVALLLLIQLFIDNQPVRYLTILPFAFSWYLGFVTMIQWLGEEPDVAKIHWGTPNPDHGEDNLWWFYPLQFALIGLPALAWLLTFRSMQDRERGWYRSDLIDSIGEMFTTGPSRSSRRGDTHADARLGGLFESTDNPRHDRESPRIDGPRPASMREFDSPQLRGDLGTLGLKSGATREEIRRAYRALAIAWHPDRFLNDPDVKAESEQKMIEIDSAYDRIERLYADRSRG